MSEEQLTIRKIEGRGFLVENGVSGKIYGCQLSASESPPTADEKTVIALCEKLATIERDTAEKCAEIAENVEKSPMSDSDGYAKGYRQAAKRVGLFIRSHFNIGEKL